VTVRLRVADTEAVLDFVDVYEGVVDLVGVREVVPVTDPVDEREAVRDCVLVCDTFVTVADPVAVGVNEPDFAAVKLALCETMEVIEGVRERVLVWDAVGERLTTMMH
jgi:hypothetical protein